MDRVARPLAEITADAMRARCGHGDCWAEPGVPCSSAPGVHIERYQRAWRKGPISAEDLTAVLAAVVTSMTPFVSEVAA
jgi:hypothetical protein